MIGWRIRLVRCRPPWSWLVFAFEVVAWLSWFPLDLLFGWLIRAIRANQARSMDELAFTLEEAKMPGVAATARKSAARLRRPYRPVRPW